MASPIGHLIHHDLPDSSSGPAPPTSLPRPPLTAPAVFPATPVHFTSAPSLASLMSPPASHSGPSTFNAQTLTSNPSTHSAPTSASTSHTHTPQQQSLPPQGHSNTQSLYQCADCLRRYSRPEHLQRHIATHTLGKRFTCDICSKAFSRADLLKRHRTNHQDGDGTKRRRVNSSPAAGRVAHACHACAKARVKCEEMKPCTRCKNRGIQCESASSEDAALHLLHLSAARGPVDQTDSSPESPYSPHPSAHGHTQQHPQPSSTASSHSFSHPSQIVPQLPLFLDQTSPTDAPQPPTPETLVNRTHPQSYQSAYPAPAMDDMERLPFTDFLRDLLYDQSGQDVPKLADPPGLAVLDFCDNANLDLIDVDFGLLNQWNVQGAMDMTGPHLTNQHDSVDISAIRSKLVKIWTESPWRWSPAKSDTGYVEQTNLPLPSREINGSQPTPDRVIKDKLLPSSRDKIMAIILSNCRENSVRSRVASTFPSADLIDSWVHIFLASHLVQVSAWIHYGSFELNSQWPEWLAIAAAAGAVLTPLPTLRRFGLALQEAVRLTIPDRFEENNTKIADIGLVQSLMLVQDVGLWSGNRRKMEIAECHMSIPIAMMRYRGKFQRSHYPHIVVEPSDEGAVLEEKWKTWYQLESWKRLAFHAYLRDAQVSMTQFCNPSMSYAELTLPLPCSKELWFARTAEEFKIRYLEARLSDSRPAPSLGDLFRDVNLLSANHYQLDVQFAISIYLHGFWSLIWEYRQLSTVFRPLSANNHTPNTSSLLLASRHQELIKLLQNFQVLTNDWHEMLSAQESLVLHLLFMNLQVSLDDLQLFSGKEGEERARAVYPTLQLWTASAEARHALWHAGQILRLGKSFPPGHLKDFYAVAVHHAALCMWTHGVIVKALPQHPPQGYGEEMVFLDGDGDSATVGRFLTFGHGRAAIRGPDTALREPSRVVRLVGDAKGCMDVAQDVLLANFAARESLPPISENIVHLLKQLGNAAQAVGLS